MTDAELIEHYKERIRQERRIELLKKKALREVLAEEKKAEREKDWRRKIEINRMFGRNYHIPPDIYEEFGVKKKDGDSQ